MDEDDNDDNDNNDPRNDPLAIAKRAARQEKHHRRESSAATPQKFYHENYDPEKYGKIEQQKTSSEAEQKRQMRAEKKKLKLQPQQQPLEEKHQRNQSSLGYRSLFGEGDKDIESNDPKALEKAKKRTKTKITTISDETCW